ncbi:thioesterase II family protein [Derxia lacustris]|uniref:thioesterase II family protein n=1 Tax=Derxia lacustris TaxID=764842 RepID=UPI000A174A23|nr:alpha/beta fold hydrolase [Derxia lacustris]
MNPITLFCLPCAGASATMYLRWRRHLPAWLRLQPIELPGRGARLDERPVDDFDALVELLLAEHASAFNAPHCLFGHSMGGLLAHGLARRRFARGELPPAALLISAVAAPPRLRDRPRPDRNDDAALIADLRRQGGTPAALYEAPELLRLTLDVLRADYGVCDSAPAVGGPRLPLALHVFGGCDDDIAAEALAAWADETSGSFTLDWYAGGHFYLRQNEVALVARIVQALEPLRALAPVAAPGR